MKQTTTITINQSGWPADRRLNLLPVNVSTLKTDLALETRRVHSVQVNVHVHTGVHTQVYTYMYTANRL